MTVKFPLCAILVGLQLLAPGEAKDGPQFPSVNVFPSQIQLGALEYGDNHSRPIYRQVRVSGLPAGTVIADIDCSHAPGVRILSKAQDERGIFINLEIDESQLCGAEPFGAYVQRQIRFQTDSVAFPQFVVSIVGWLDVNKTARDYSQFVYDGAARWQGWWATPNEAGAILSVVALVATGVFGLLRRHFVESRRWFVAPSMLVVLCVMSFALPYLGLTYSRGSWLALIAGYLVMLASSRSLRPVALSGLAVFLGILVLLPQGVHRIESYTTVRQDLSIINRLRLWEGALQMMADHPLTGVGSGNFATGFERDYQTFDHTARTSTAVSDYLTLGAEHGLIPLSILLGLISALLVLSVRAASKSDEAAMIVLTATSIDLLVSSCFSTLWCLPEYRWLSVTVESALAVYLGFKLILEQGYTGFFQSFLRLCSIHITAAIGVLSFISFGSLLFLPTEVSRLEIHSQNGEPYGYASVQPRWSSPRGIIIYFGDCSHTGTFFHSTVRPLAALGWRVIPVPASSEPGAIHELVEYLHQSSPGLNTFVAGETMGACTAWTLAAEESPNLISAGGGLNFLSMDMDGSDAKRKPTQPFLVYQSLYTNGTSSDPAICAENQVAFKGVPLTVVLSQDELNHFSTGWMKFLETINTFFSNETRRANG